MEQETFREIEILGVINLKRIRCIVVSSWDIICFEMWRRLDIASCKKQFAKSNGREYNGRGRRKGGGIVAEQR